MYVELNYGKKTLGLQCRAEWDITVLNKRSMPVIEAPATAIAQALDSPVQCAPLRSLARAAGRVCILICDITRPVPNKLFLPVIVDTLLDNGVAPDAITILVATGLHRPNLGEELAELIGDQRILQNIRIINHDARDETALADLGLTRNNTRVLLNRHFVQADLRIATGLVEPHFMAGYSGGRKVIAPGIAGKETITTFHNARFMGHPGAANCILDGNPLHQEQLEIVALLGGALALNTVIDENRQLSFVNFGEIVASHLQAVAFIRRFAEIAVSQRFKTVVTSAAGYPLDKTYYQTVKGMVSPIDILEPGGDLIIASSCDEGLGSAEYIDAQKRLCQLGPEAFLRDIRQKSHADVDEWQTQMQLKPMSIGSISLYSEYLSETDRRLTGIRQIVSLADTIQESISRHADNRVAIIPEGPYVVPYYQPATPA